MFCSYCGENLIETNQKFCHNCGVEIVTTSKATDYKTERIPNVTTVPKIVYVPVKQQRQIGIPGTYSKWCLGLGIFSLLIGIITLIIGYNFFRIFFWYEPYDHFPGLLMMAILILLFRVGGLIMGIFSKVNSSKAELLEPYNDAEKAGSILGILGIILNIIGLFASLFGPWGIFNFPY